MASPLILYFLLIKESVGNDRYEGLSNGSAEVDDGDGDRPIFVKGLTNDIKRIQSED